MRRLRTRRSLLLFSIGVAVFSALLPAYGSAFSAVLIPLWIVPAPVLVMAIRRRPTRRVEQSVSLLSRLPSRAPPLLLPVA